MKNEPKTVNGPHGWRATLKAANATAERYQLEGEQIHAANARLCQLLHEKNATIKALDEFGAMLIRTLQKYQSEGR